MTASGLTELIHRFDAALRAELAERAEELPEAGPLISEIARMLDAGGKRLRPAFCYWAFRAAGGEDSDAIVRAASGLELLHTFALVHDDIMDSSPTRRGTPTVHARHGVDVAVLTGDLALVLADHMLMTAPFPAENALDAFDAYSRMRREVIAGQFLDVSAGADVTEEKTRLIARLKSGRYSVQEPLVIGVRLAGGSKEIEEGLEGFGAPLGEAFQLRDDLLGTFGSDSVTGKPVDSDIREGKRHLLFARAAAALSGDERDFFISRWGSGADLSDDDVARLRSLLESSGARAAVEESLDRLAGEAMDTLRSLSMPDDPARELEGLAAAAVRRDR